MARNDLEDTIESSSCLDRRKMVQEGVENSVSDENTIHSGHFMLSCLKDEPEEEITEEDKVSGYDFDSANKLPTETYQFAPPNQAKQSIDIDNSLTKLFQCMSLAYSGKLTSPKWKNFKGLKLTIKDKVRLNNIIWREWHMQYIQGKYSRICQFEPPVTDRAHSKAEAVVLEGKYWKRKLSAVTAEYQKWRLYHKQKHVSQKEKDAMSEVLRNVRDSSSVFRFGRTNVRSQLGGNTSQSPTVEQLISDDDFMDLSDTLFSSFNTAKPFAFPDPRDFGQLNNADIIQPGLLQLQPTIEEDMDTQSLEPLPSLQEMMAGQMFSRSHVSLGQAGMLIDCPPSPLNDVLFGSDTFFSDAQLSAPLPAPPPLTPLSSQPQDRRRASAGSITEYYDSGLLDSTEQIKPTYQVQQLDSFQQQPVLQQQQQQQNQPQVIQLQPQQSQGSDAAVQLLQLLLGSNINGAASQLQQLLSTNTQLSQGQSAGGGQLPQQSLVNLLLQIQGLSQQQNTQQSQQQTHNTQQSQQQSLNQQQQNQQQSINQQQQSPQQSQQQNQQQQQQQSAPQLQNQNVAQQLQLAAESLQQQQNQQQLQEQLLQQQIISEQKKQQQLQQQQQQQRQQRSLSNTANNSSLLRNIPTKGSCQGNLRGNSGVISGSSEGNSRGNSVPSTVQVITQSQLQNLLQGQQVLTHSNLGNLSNAGNLSNVGNLITTSGGILSNLSSHVNSVKTVTFDTSTAVTGSAVNQALLPRHSPVQRSHSTQQVLVGGSSPTLSGHGGRRRSKSGEAPDHRRHSAGSVSAPHATHSGYSAKRLGGFLIPQNIVVPKSFKQQVKIAPAPSAHAQSVPSSLQASQVTSPGKPSPASQNTFLAALLTSDTISGSQTFPAIKEEKQQPGLSHSSQSAPHMTSHYHVIKPKPAVTHSVTAVTTMTTDSNNTRPIATFDAVTPKTENVLSEYEKGLLIAANSQLLPGSTIRISDILNNSATIIQSGGGLSGMQSGGGAMQTGGILSNPNSPQMAVASPSGSSDSPSDPRSRHASSESLDSVGPPAFSLGSVKEETSPGATRRRSDLDPTAYREHRRASHINAEQKRRYNIKHGFDTLCQLVPNLTQNPNAKISKASILHKSASYCQKLKKERTEMQTEAELLKHEIEAINTAIGTCQSQLPATGVPVTRQRVNQMKGKFEEYVRQRTLQNWKFWIFSIIISPLFDTYNNMVSMATMEDLCRTTLAWLEQHCALPALRPVVLNSLRELSTSTTILSDPGAVAEQALQAVQGGHSGQAGSSGQHSAAGSTDNSNDGTPL